MERGGGTGHSEGVVAHRSGIVVVRQRRTFEVVAFGRRRGALVVGEDRRRALEHRERKRSEMHGQIENREGQVVEITWRGAMAAAATNAAVAMVLRRPPVDER
jgi:hypothetical protein